MTRNQIAASFVVGGLLGGTLAILVAAMVDSHVHRGVRVALDPIEVPAMLITGELSPPILRIEDMPPVVSTRRPYNGEPIRIGTTVVERRCFQHELSQGGGPDAGSVVVCESAEER